MKTTDHAINRIYQIISDATGINCPVYILTKPTKVSPSEFIVINALPIDAGVLQKCHINVNCYASDLQPGIPDLTNLEGMTASIMNILEEVSATGMLIDFERQEYFRDELIDKHYSNTRFSVKIINT